MLSAGEFARQFKNPFLRNAIPQIFSWDEAPVMMGMSLLAYMHTGNAGFPVGGSLEFARAIEKRFLELGGEICYKSQVEKILVDAVRGKVPFGTLSNALIPWPKFKKRGKGGSRRAKLGIGRLFDNAPDWTPAEDKLMGTGPDQEIAAKLGRSKHAVQRRRLKLGIAVFRRT